MSKQARIRASGLSVQPCTRNRRNGPFWPPSPAKAKAEEIKLRAERRAGELLKEMPKATGAKGTPGGQGAPVVRLQAATTQTHDELAIELPSQPYEGNDPFGFVISLNLHRRHLNGSQRAMIAAKVASCPVGSNQHAPNGAPFQDKAADLLNASRRTVQRAKAVLDSGDASLVEQIEAGDLTVNAAVTELRRRENAARREEPAANAPFPYKPVAGSWRPSSGGTTRKPS